MGEKAGYMIKKEFGQRLEGITYTPRPGVYGVGFRKVELLVDGIMNLESVEVAVIHTPRGRFLPGGGIEEGEIHEECLKREFIEESGYRVEIGEFIGESQMVGLTPRTNRYVELQGNFYLVTIEEHGEGQIEDDHELIWLSLEEAIESLKLSYQSYAVTEGLKKFITL